MKRIRMPAEGPFPAVIVFDKTLMRPGCAILQTSMGGTLTNMDLELVGGEWLTSPTADLRPYTIYTAEEFDRVREVVRAFHEAKKAVG